MDHGQSVLRPERHPSSRVHGNRPHPTPGSREFPEGLAEARTRRWEQQPTAAVAKRGRCWCRPAPSSTRLA